MTTHADGPTYRSLGAARTLSGRDIYKRLTDRQNHFRSRLSELSWSVVSSLERHGLAESLLSGTVAKLRVAKNDPQHYGDNKPGAYFDDGPRTAVVPDRASAIGTSMSTASLAKAASTASSPSLESIPQ